MNNVALALASGIVALGIVVAAMFQFWAQRARTESRKMALAQRLGTLSGGTVEGGLFLDQETDEIAEHLGSFGLSIQSTIRQAGKNETVGSVLTRMAIFAIAGQLISQYLIEGAMGLVGLLVGFLPLFVLRVQATRRSEHISAQLPDCLDLMARTMRAGHALTAAVEICVEELPAPLGNEFAVVHQEHSLGRDVRACLVAMSKRNQQNFDIRLLVSAILLQRQTGGNLVEVLEGMSNTVRERFVFCAKVKALTSEARFSAIILGCLPLVVTFAVVVMRPGYLHPLFDDPWGQNLLTFAVGSFCCGALAMRKISQVRL